MIDAQAVELAQHLRDAALEESKRGASIQRGIEQRVVPWLPCGIGPARRSAHAQGRQEDRRPAPDALVRDSDLKVAVEPESEGLCFRAEGRVLLVGEELLELVARDEISV